MRFITATLVGAILCVSGYQSAFAQGRPQTPNEELSIFSVIVDFSTNLITITGENFDNGTVPVVALGEFGTLGSTLVSPTVIDANLPAFITAGDFLLVVTTGQLASQSAQYDLTISAAGVVSFPTGNTRGGTDALISNTSGSFNSAYGIDALFSNTTGEGNTASGFQALRLNTIGDGNSAYGAFALENNTTGDGNTASGVLALQFNTTGISNTASGVAALESNTTGRDNTAIGAEALNRNTTGDENTASGSGALQNNTTGRDNTASGRGALGQNTTGFSNTAVGRSALVSNTIGNNNIAIGLFAGSNQITGSNNITIGNTGVAAESNTIRIGRFLQTRAFVAGIRGVTTGGSAVTVVIDSNGQLGTVSSSRRYKEQIYDMEAASERLLSLRPVTFRYKKAFEGGDKPLQFGLIAEEVAEVFPELVVYSEDGAPEAVKYRLLSTLLLNELQKEYQVNQRQEAELRGQRTELRDMQARLVRLEIARAGAVASIQ